MNAVTEYAKQVKARKIVTGQLVRLACERHLEDLKRSRRRTFPYRFDEDLADESFQFIEKLKLTKGRQFFNQPFLPELWQKFIIGSIFGWVGKKDRLRRFRWAYIEVARKNGKSELGGAIGLKMAFFDGEAGAEVYSAATTRDQAKIIWEKAKMMVRLDTGLAERIDSWRLNMSRPDTGSKFEPLSSDHSKMDGLSTHCALIDEVHAHPDHKLVDVLESSMGARLQPLQFETTTAGEYNEQSICWSHREISRQVLEGLIPHDEWFAYVATIDKEDDWRDPSCWIKANPNLGVSKIEKSMEQEFKKTQGDPAAENTFRRYHCNQWVHQAQAWISMELWKNCIGNVDRAALRGKRCFAGLDLASTDDMNALVLIFPDDGYQVLPFFWVPEDTVRRRARQGRIRYDAWVEQGYLKTTPGNVTDFRLIEKEYIKLLDEFRLQALAIDEWNAMSTAVRLQDETEEDHVALWRQSMSNMAGPTKELKRLIKQGVLQHGDNPILTWMFDNIVIRIDVDENEKIDRKKSSDGGKKVDGMVALVMALGVAIKTKEAPGNAYDRRGILIL